MLEEFSKRYDFQDAEARVSGRWLEAKAFHTMPDTRDRRYVIMMPLPNVTGALHMGHAMDNVMQDLLIRWHRMMGENALWQPGTDHAGIATQAVVEKRLFELEGKTRHDIGRTALIQRIWDWKDQYQARIIAQQQRMGCSCDWDRQRFTMDAVCAGAVRECFFRLFKDGLIYRGSRLVNWDCLLQTAVSDDEIIVEPIQSHFWHLRYPVIDPAPGEPTHVEVATTRPETMLGDTAVACHPDPEKALNLLIEEIQGRLGACPAKEREDLQKELDRLEERRKSVLPLLVALRDMALAGHHVMLPLQNRPIPLIVDEWAKPDVGTGCVKITPGHDPNDYDVWMRHRGRIELINLLNPDGTLNENAGAYRGMDRFLARDKVVQDLTALGLVGEIEDREIPLGHSDRSKTPIEPYLSKQWFVRMGDIEGGVVLGRGTSNEFKSPGLAQAAIDAAEGRWTSTTGRRLTFYPDSERYASTYLNWLKEKRDWCISRQLWWGHQIPIWLGVYDESQLQKLLQALPDSTETLWVWIANASGEILSRDQALRVTGQGPYEVQVCFRSQEDFQKHQALLQSFELVQDPDVLDTWFSSALWPFSTLGWPNPSGAEVNPGQTPLGASQGLPDSLAYYYPGSCLVTARDIITLWVARMQLAGLYNLGDVPFTDCFIHANIQDGKGERMSKSKGNGIDPVDIIDRYGTDALRYVLCDMQSGTQDIRLPVQAESPFTGHLIDLAAAKHGRSIFTYICPESGKEFDVLGTIPELPKATLVSDRFEVGRAFCTKLWNAARFAFLSLGDHAYAPLAWSDLREEDRWILSRLSKTIEAVTAQLRGYNPSLAISTARDFFWSEVCDWYIEMIKPRFKNDQETRIARSVLSVVLDQVFRLFHPFVPFITEVLWERLNAQAPQRGISEPLPGSELLLHAPWPVPVSSWEDSDIEKDFDLLRDVVREIRNMKAKHNLPPKKELACVIKAAGVSREALNRLFAHIQSQAFVVSLEIADSPRSPKNAATGVVGDVEIYLEGVLDPDKERSRLEKQRADIVKEIEMREKKLSNDSFVSRAKPEVVQMEKDRLADAKAQLESVDKAIKSFV